MRFRNENLRFRNEEPDRPGSRLRSCRPLADCVFGTQSVQLESEDRRFSALEDTVSQQQTQSDDMRIQISGQEALISQQQTQSDDIRTQISGHRALVSPPAPLVHFDIDDDSFRAMEAALDDIRALSDRQMAQLSVQQTQLDEIQIESDWQLSELREQDRRLDALEQMEIRLAGVRAMLRVRFAGKARTMSSDLRETPDCSGGTPFDFMLSHIVSRDMSPWCGFYQSSLGASLAHALGNLQPQEICQHATLY